MTNYYITNENAKTWKVKKFIQGHTDSCEAVSTEPRNSDLSPLSLPSFIFLHLYIKNNV